MSQKFHIRHTSNPPQTNLQALNEFLTAFPKFKSCVMFSLSCLIIIKKIVYGRDLGKKTWEMCVEPEDKDFHLKRWKEI